VRAPLEPCELCGAALPAEHPHLLETATRGVRCVCRACGLLFDGKVAGGASHRRIPADHRLVTDLRLDEPRWAELAIPVRLAYLVRASPSGHASAFYPGAMGAAEAPLHATAWNALVADNPVLGALEPDVEALLVHRVGAACEHWRVPIDACYRLVAILRSRWKGLSGGVDAWEAVRAYFEDLRARSRRIDRHGRSS
jgi:hypothetical protein